VRHELDNVRHLPSARPAVPAVRTSRLPEFEDLDPSTVRRIENGVIALSVCLIFVIAAFCGVAAEVCK
jgi:hypothetical protein